MTFLALGLVYVGYGFMFWGATLLGGGPGQTGAWPLMYVLLGLGPKPKVVGGSAADPFSRQTAGTAGGPEQRFQAGGTDQATSGTLRPGQPS